MTKNMNPKPSRPPTKQEQIDTVLQLIADKTQARDKLDTEIVQLQQVLEELQKTTFDRIKDLIFKYVFLI